MCFSWVHIKLTNEDITDTVPYYDLECKAITKELAEL